MKNLLTYFLCTLMFVVVIATDVHAQTIDLGEHIRNSKNYSNLSSKLHIKAQRSNFSFPDIKAAHYTYNDNQYVTINAIAKYSGKTLANDLTSLGMIKGEVAGLIVSGLLPANAIYPSAQLESLNYITENRSTFRNGSVTSQGLQAMRVDEALNEYDLDGNGITIGVISDSYDCFAQSDESGELSRTASIDIANGDLPADTYALEESDFCTFMTDEGRALMQILHDIAPKAKLVFLSGANGLARTANGIIRLTDEIGVDLIVDDSASGLETYFQDGPIAQAITWASNKGVTYVTSAGNNARNSYQSQYRETINSVLDINAHDFDAGEGVDVFQEFTLNAGATIVISLHWSNPAYSVSGPPGAQTDLDLFIINKEETEVIEAATFINTGKDPNEFIQFQNPASSDQTEFKLLISKASGPSPQLIKYVIEGRFDGEIKEYQTTSGTIVGRANTSSAISVGAARYDQTPVFGLASPILRFFSSAGGDTPILFDIDGTPLRAPIYRQKPEIVGPDGVNTTFFNFCEEEPCTENPDTDNDSLPNFLGTSAAAPHIAGVAALLLQVNANFQPADIKSIIQQTAVDITLRSNKSSESEFQSILEGVGVDNDSGHGFIDAIAAVRLAQSYVASEEIEFDTEPEIDLLEPTAKGGGGVVDSLLLIIFYIGLLCRREFLTAKSC